MSRSIRFVLVLSIAFVVGGHAPGAWACSCAPHFSDADNFETTSIVFVGAPTASDDPHTGDGPINGADEIKWTFDVESVQKGTVTDPQIVSSARDGAACGYQFTVGERYQIWGSKSGDTVKTNICSGTRPLDDEAAYREHDPAAGARIVGAGTTTVLDDRDTRTPLPRSGAPVMPALVLGAVVLLMAAGGARMLRTR